MLWIETNTTESNCTNPLIAAVLSLYFVNLHKRSWKTATALPSEISEVPLAFIPTISRVFSKGDWKQCSHVGV